MTPPMRSPRRIRALLDLAEARERRLVALLAMVFMLLLAGPAQLSPDGAEMFAALRGGSWGSWPPLWPALLAAIPWPDPTRAGFLLNLLLAGAVAWPLHLLAHRLGGRWAARLAVALWLLLPAMRWQAAVLDARPLGWLLYTLALALSVDALARQRSLWPAVLVAGVAPLGRPEGIFVLPLVALAAWLVHPRRRTLLAQFVALLAPLGCWTGLRRGGRLAWEIYGTSWHGVWPNADFMALTSAASAPTGFRRFLLAADAAGLESPPLDPRFLLRLAPHGMWDLAQGLLGALGVGMLVALAAGAVLATRRHQTGRLALAGVVLPLSALVLLPMAWGQGSPAANLLFVLPPALALLTTCLPPLLPRIGPAGVAALVLLAGVELHLAPWSARAPSYVEASQAALNMGQWLRQHPPTSGAVACSYAGRSVVRSAHLTPLALPSMWEAWQAAPGVAVLLAPDLGDDGGRGLALLEDPAWQVSWATGEADPSSGAWFVLLTRVEDKKR